MPPRALWLNSRSRATAATLHVFRRYLGTPPEHQPYISARARYELGLSPLLLSTMTTLSGSHVIAGAACSGLEQPGECASDSHDGGRWVAVGGAPLGRVAWSRLPGSAHRSGSGTVLIGSIPLSTLNAQPPELKLCFKAWTQRVPSVL